MRRFGAVVLQSAIAAAFIGPGTVTSCASAGASFGPALLWALTFSTLACLVLQEAAARLTVGSGLTLGQALRRRFSSGAAGAAVTLMVVGAVILGCAAYQAGNVLGAVAGAKLLLDVPSSGLALLVGGAAALVLGVGRIGGAVRVLSALVAVMGVAFLVTAVLVRPPVVELVRGALVPALPAGAGLLVLALVGTTVVPYNLFLGSGLAEGQRLAEVRFGLAVSVGLGGVISMAILVVGTAVTTQFSYQALAEVLSERLGRWAQLLFAGGLFAAGFTSAITAPLAAALTARSLFGSGAGWQENGRWFRTVWGGVLLTGVGFGAAGLPPIPAIVAAQALNGVLLPLVAVFLLLVINDPEVVGESGRNGPLANAAMLVATGVAVLLGVAAMARAAARVLALAEPPLGLVAALAGAVMLVVTVAVLRRRGVKGA
jgi:Mn2+/Fe2+ NRAMP family transporter